MKVNLSFSLPKEKVQFLKALNDGLYLAGIQEFDDYLCGLVKYNNKLSKEQLKVVDDIRTKLHELVEDIWE